MIVSQSEFARMLGISRQAINNRITRKIIVLNQDGLIDTEDLLQMNNFNKKEIPVQKNNFSKKEIIVLARNKQSNKITFVQALRNILHEIKSHPLTHEFNLRLDFKTKITLPANLTRNEAERLKAMIDTLPFEN